MHTKRKHVIIEDIFPQACDFCETQLQSKNEIEEHLKVHTYRTVDMKCEDCDFLANDDLSLEVHAARKNSGNFECALCGFVAKDEENLNIHLHTCEIFQCSFCQPKVIMKTVPAVSSHLSSNHTKNSNDVKIYHIKMDRKDAETLSLKTVSSNTFQKNTN